MKTMNDRLAISLAEISTQRVALKGFRERGCMRVVLTDAPSEALTETVALFTLMRDAAAEGMTVEWTASKAWADRMAPRINRFAHLDPPANCDEYGLSVWKQLNENGAVNDIRFGRSFVSIERRSPENGAASKVTIGDPTLLDVLKSAQDSLWNPSVASERERQATALLAAKEILFELDPANVMLLSVRRRRWPFGIFSG